MASSRSAAPRIQKCLQIGISGRVDRALAFQELCADTGGLDNERTMSDADGGRPSDQAASWSSQSPSGFRASAGLQATSATTGLAERFPAHIEGGRFAPLLHRISSDAGARYALTDAWDSSRPGAPMADTWALTLGPKADAWRPAFRA